jgi:hypothetical protein
MFHRIYNYSRIIQLYTRILKSLINDLIKSILVVASNKVEDETHFESKQFKKKLFNPNDLLLLLLF